MVSQVRPRQWLVWASSIGLAIAARSAQAQYTANFQTNLISGISSNWSGTYYVGQTNFADVLLIRNGGILYDTAGYVGYPPGGSNSNTVLVTDSGSSWQNSGGLLLVYGSWNSLVISNKGQVSSAYGGVSGTNNSVVITDSGSDWTTSLAGGQFTVGGPGNTLVIINSGRVDSVNCLVGGCNPSGGSQLLVTGIGSILNDTGSLAIGVPSGYSSMICGAGHSLVVSNGGHVFSLLGYAGVDSSNTVLVTGNGSVWQNNLDMYVGSYGSGNSLVISNGGRVISGVAGGGLFNVYIGGDPHFAPSNANSNSVLVTGTSSVWSNIGPLSVGYFGFGNNMDVGNSGVVYCTSGNLGVASSSSNNTVHVIDGGVWRVRNNGLTVGVQGSSNSLVIADGSVVTPGLVIGSASADCDNLVELDGGSLVVTNVAHGATLEVRHGQLILSGGLLQVDNLLITNSCASFLHTGGALLAGSVTLDPNQFRITSIVAEGTDLRVTWLMGPGQSNTLQVVTGGPDGSYTANGFSDIFVVTNNPIAGAVTNYLDVGAATNWPARYYRARLVP